MAQDEHPSFDRTGRRLVDAFTPAECANYFAAAGYDPT
jgi:hypothetical protein